MQTQFKPIGLLACLLALSLFSGCAHHHQDHKHYKVTHTHQDGPQQKALPAKKNPAPRPN